MAFFREFLGFDIRIGGSEDFEKPLWDKGQREKFLLKPKVKLPLSVDRDVWPSVFKYPEPALPFENFFPPIEIPFPQFELKPQNFRHDNLRLWSDFEEMFSSFEKIRSTDFPPVTFAAFFVFSKSSFEIDEYFRAVLFPKLDVGNAIERWKFLGYDVADRYFVSGLSNCGFSREEKRKLTKKWGSLLNGFGLFSNIHEAFQFTEMTDVRVKEHSPFFVYGLYEVVPPVGTPAA